MTEVCEHGHLARKCEVCELRAEVTRLRGVCRLSAERLASVKPWLSSYRTAYESVGCLITDLKAEGSKSDGQ